MHHTPRPALHNRYGTLSHTSNPCQFRGWCAVAPRRDPSALPAVANGYAPAAPFSEAVKHNSDTTFF
jgi:hypothetical protein